MVAELMFTVKNAWFDDGRICLLLSDDREIRFPVAANKRLNHASSEQLNNIEIICEGTGLHWPDLDEDLSVTGILEGRLG
jgi:hypothetical protein